MNIKCLLSLTVLSLFSTAAAFGQRTLPSDEARQIFQKVTSEPRKTWLPAGTIEATHQEYRAAKVTDAAEVSGAIDTKVREYLSSSTKRELTEEGQKMKLDALPFNVRYRLANEFTMISYEVVKYDGDRFYWSIDVSSREDSVKPDASLAGNFMTDHFDLSWNQSRVFIWDGDKYTTYTASGNQAMVDAAGKSPRAVNGPLTAGVVPWGYGPFTYAELTATKVAATETSISSESQVQMTLTRSDGSVMKFTLDPSKNYAVTACTIPLPNGTIASYLYSGYKQVGVYWVPSSITMERHEPATNRLLRSEQWTFTSISGDTPTSDSFAFDYPRDTFVEYTSPVTKSPLMYQTYSSDADRLLAERLTYAATQGKEARNCATVALRQAASVLGKSVSESRLARLVGPDGRTSLHAMKQFTQSLGLYCRAVKTDLAALRDLKGVQIILHIPGKHHFVVLDRVDDWNVRLIDLSGNKFYYPQSVYSFPAEWSQGTALLLSNQPIPGRFTDLSDNVQTTILGGYWTCTRLYQERDIVYCDERCTSTYEEYFERFTCESAPAGSCQGTVFIRWKESPCDWDEFLLCVATGEWIYHWMRGCYP